MAKIYLLVGLLSLNLFVMSSLNEEYLERGRNYFYGRFPENGKIVLARVAEVFAIVKYSDTLLDNLRERRLLKNPFRYSKHRPSCELEISKYFMRACCAVSRYQTSLRSDFGFVIYPTVAGAMVSGDEVAMRHWLLNKHQGVGFAGRELEGFEQCQDCQRVLQVVASGDSLVEKAVRKLDDVKAALLKVWNWKS